MKAERAKHSRESRERRELRRDREFREELARAWDVESAPRSLHKALEQTYAQLPPELIYRRRPLRSFLRGVAGAGAVCAAACLALFCLNLTEPQFTESLPLVGAAFQSLNSKLRPQEDLPSGDREPSQAPESSWTGESSPTEENALSPLPVRDGEAQLLSATLSRDGVLKLEVQLPFLGLRSYDLTYGGEALPMGIYPRLVAEDGTQFTAGSLQMQDQDSYFATDENGRIRLYDDIPQGPVTLYLGFSASDYSSLFQHSGGVLTFYESGDGLYSGAPSDYEFVGHRVAAEFTLDWSGERVTARPSREYEKQGLRRIPDQGWGAEDWNTFQSGWLAAGVNVAVWDQTPDVCETYFKVSVFGQDERRLRLNCYYRDDLVRSMETVPAQEMEDVGVTVHDSPIFLDLNIDGQSWYQMDDCCWTDGFTNPTRTGKFYRQVVFAVPVVWYQVEDQASNAYAVQNSGARFQLVDADTGEVLLDDIAALAEQGCQNFLYWWNEACRPAAQEDEGIAEASAPAPLPSPSPGTDSQRESN